MILTAGDVVNRLIDFAGGQQGGDLLVNKCRRALQDAVRDFPTMYRWNWYKTLGRVNLTKSETTGTIAYDAATRVVTLTGSTFPTWAAGSMIRVGQVVGRVLRRTDSTHVLMDPNYTFPAAIAAGSGFRIFQDAYQLPANFSAALTPMREDWWGGLRYVPATSWLWGIRGYDCTGVPVKFTIQPRLVAGAVTPGGGGGFALYVSPYPNCDRTLDFMYYRVSRPVVYDIGVNVGTLSTNADGLTCTFGVSQFVPSMVGSIIRITNSKNAPELKGTVIHETTIATVPSGVSVTLTDACPLVNTSNLGFSVSDPIDVDTLSMGTCFQLMAMKSLAVETMSKGAAAVAASFNDAYNTAKAADARYAGPDRVGPVGGGGSPFWHGPVTTETE
jgi:hypothetical protein